MYRLQKSRHTSRGFTIVELLIVIVVIAILAAITIVGYQNIQRRAHNAAIISSVKQWVNILTISYAENGSVTITDLPTGTAGICLGDTQSYPATSQFAQGVCYDNGGRTYRTSEQAAAIARDIGSSGARYDEQNTTPTDSGVFARGVQYGEAYHGSQEFHIFYDLRGANQECIVPGSNRNGSTHIATDCSINLYEQLGGNPLSFTPTH